LRMIETGALVDPGFAKKTDIESLNGALPMTGDTVGSSRLRTHNRRRYETTNPTHKQGGVKAERGNVTQRERQQNRMKFLLPTDNSIPNEQETNESFREELKLEDEETHGHQAKKRNDGPELKKEQFAEWLREYFEDRLNTQQMLRHLTQFRLNPKKTIEWSFRIAMDKEKVEQEQTTILWRAMIKDGCFTSKNLAETMTEFFESYTAELSDVPRLAEYLSRMLAPLFVDGELNLKLVEEWLQKDPGMTKPHKKGSKLSKQLEVIGRLFGAIRDYSNEITTQDLVRTSKFDLDKFLPEDLRNDFSIQFKLQWYF